jgi:hypothetical protein
MRQTQPKGIRAAVAGFVLLLAPAAAPATPDLSITNHATLSIAELYVSAAEDDSWGDSRIRNNIAPGQSYHLLGLRARACRLDMRVIYSDGSIEDKRGLDGCHTHQVTFDAATAIAPPALAHSHAVRHVVISNHASRAIVEVYVSSAATDDWGDDLVAQHPIAANGAGEIKPDVSCLADLRIVFDNRSAEERRDLDLCAHARLDIRPGWTTNEDAPQLQAEHPSPGAQAKQ